MHILKLSSIANNYKDQVFLGLCSHILPEFLRQILDQYPEKAGYRHRLRGSGNHYSSTFLCSINILILASS